MIKFCGELQDFNIERGLRQRDSLSTLLFNLIMQKNNGNKQGKPKKKLTSQQVIVKVMIL